MLTNQHRSVNTFSRFVALGQVPLTGSSFHFSAKDRLGQHGRKVWLVGRAIHSNTVNRVCLKFGLILPPFFCQNKKSRNWRQILGTLLPVRLVAIFVVGMVGIFASFACVTGRMNSLRFGFLPKRLLVEDQVQSTWQRDHMTLWSMYKQKSNKQNTTLWSMCTNNNLEVVAIKR